jgi:hypothetical protein
MFSADTTRLAVISSLMAHPTTLRLKASRTTAKYTKPHQVGI